MCTTKIAFILTLAMMSWGCGLPDNVPSVPVIDEQDIENTTSDSGTSPSQVVEDVDSGANEPELPINHTDGGHEEEQPVTSTDAGFVANPVFDAGLEDTICDAGFLLDGGACVAVDLCENIDCGVGVCVVGTDGPTCDCAAGYQDNDQDLTCNIGCATVSCIQYWTCEDSSGTAECVCDEGTQMVDESCEAILCDQNEFVSAHECVTCEGGLYNTAGDSAYEGDTTCDADCIEDSHCPLGDECSSNNECVSAGCTSHFQCIEEFAETLVSSPDYACGSDGLCVGLAPGKCYIATHCSNDNGTPYCDGSNSTLGDCQGCLENDHCIYDDNDNVINANGACFNGFCGSLLSGNCYADINCEDENGTYCLLGNGNTLGECKVCILDEHCDEIFGGPPGNANYHYECNNHMCQSVLNDGNEIGPDRD
jgi:hypothetical protein